MRPGGKPRRCSWSSLRPQLPAHNHCSLALARRFLGVFWLLDIHSYTSALPIRDLHLRLHSMAGPSRGASPTKRLMTELQTYQRDPSDELLELGPADEDVMHWRAVMKGVDGTAYEGTSLILHPSPTTTQLTPHRRRLAPRHPHPADVPQRATRHPLHHAHLPPERRLPHRRDLPRRAEERVDPGLHDCRRHDQRAPAADERGAGQPAECRCCAAAAWRGSRRG